MKSLFKQATSVFAALSMTVCGVTALALNVSAASANGNTGYTEYHTTYYPDVTTEDPTYPDDVIYEDISLDHNSVSAVVMFKNNALPSVDLEEESRGSTILKGTLKNVPASSEPYYFVISYRTVHASGIYDGIKTDGNGLYEFKGGVYFAFFNSAPGDVTFKWDKSSPDTVSVYGSKVTMMKSQIPFYGDLEDDLTEPYTEPGNYVSGPYDIWTTSPEPEVTEASTTGYEIYAVGDVNMDSRVNVSDATMVQRFISKSIKLTAEQQKLADTNGDGFVSIKDATIIQKRIAKISD